MALVQPSVCRQGGLDGRGSGHGGRDRWTQPSGRAGHQDQPDLLQGPQRGRGAPQHGENTLTNVFLTSKEGKSFDLEKHNEIRFLQCG